MAANHSKIDTLFAETSTAPQKYRTPKKRKTLRNLLIVLGSLLVLVGIAVGAAYAMINMEYNNIERVDVFDPRLERPAALEVPAGSKPPVNILLLGSDSREATDPNARAEDLRGFRSDAILVAQISPDRKNITIMSIMRDNWVSIQGHGEAKINAAIAYGGIPLAVNTVETMIDARIDHVALIDFESFRDLTDAVGGVAVNNPIPFTADHGGFNFAKGEITLNGEQSLGFVRERYAFADGDFQRVRDQQIYLKGLIDRIFSKDTLTSPTKVTNSFDALKPYLIVDSGLDFNTVIGLGLELRELNKSNITFFTSPTLGTGVSSDGQSIVLPDWTEIANLRTAMRDGTLDHYAATRTPGASS